MTSTTNPFLKHVKERDDYMERIRVIKKLVQDELNIDKCSVCNGGIVIKTSPKTLHYQLNGEGKKLTINDAPYIECNSCEQVTENIGLYARIREMLEDEIFHRINNRETIPREVEWEAVIE